MVARLILSWLIAAIAFATPAFAQDGGGAGAGWWNRDWPYRRAITVDTSPTGANLSGTMGRSVVLVRLHNGNFNFSDTLENGADLRVVDSDGKTPLPFHIERFDAANGIGAIWVSVPNLNGGEKRRLWLYFGDKNASAGSDVAGTYDPDTIAAYHFSENTGTATADLTANKNNAGNAPAGIDDNGIIARAGRFTGQGVTIPASASLTLPAGSPFTLTTWVRPQGAGAEQAIVARGAMVLGLAGTTPFVAINGARLQARQAIQPGQWAHLALVADGQAIRLYVNGVEAAAAQAALPALADPIVIGGTPDRPFAGEIDETRLSKAARAAAAIAVAAQSEGPQNKIVSVSDQPERQSEGGGTLGFIIGKVETVDAIIIGLCMVMLAVALTVIVTKAMYVGRASRNNQAFMRRYRQMDEDLVPLKDVPGITPHELEVVRSAPLGRIYEEGYHELMLRRQRLGDRPLTGEAVEAMRAAVDAVVVEENQKLDRWMVLLTIAISGGPFVGLLGTVMGVMNTFGGVAMAGDVNVNAIAPGIAAALLATIAGLSCAIPSLFAYNYLNTRISTIADDMRVFVDRLITRLAEMQADQAPPPLLRAAE